MIAGLRTHVDAFALLARERRLWAWVVLPVVVSLVSLSSAIAVLIAFAPELWGLATGWLPVLEPSSALAWLWVGPAKVLFLLVGCLVAIAIAGSTLVVAFLLGSVVAAPLHDALSRRVEQVVTGGVIDGTPPGIRGVLGFALRAMLAELGRVAAYLALQVPIVLVGIVAPGGAVVAPIASAVLAAHFLPLEHAGLTLDRRGATFADRRRWLRAHRSSLVAYGLVAFAVLLVPLVNVVAMPVFVVGGTLLALRLPLTPRDRAS